VRCPTCHLINPPSAVRCDCGRELGAAASTNPLPEPRKRTPLPRRTKISIVVVFAGVLAYCLYEYFALQFPVGHACHENKDCRSSRCLRTPGICTDSCHDDSDCLATMKCGDGTSQTVRYGVAGDPAVIKLCLPR
jgi:hypothetical protein